MDENDLDAVKIFKSALEKSKEYLGNMTALQLLEDSDTLHNSLRELLRRQKLPKGLVIGILMCEILDLGENTLTDVAILEMLRKNIDLKFVEMKTYIDTRLSLLKKNIDDNYMKKEITTV